MKYTNYKVIYKNENGEKITYTVYAQGTRVGFKVNGGALVIVDLKNIEEVRNVFNSIEGDVDTKEDLFSALNTAWASLLGKDYNGFPKEYETFTVSEGVEMVSVVKTYTNIMNGIEEEVSEDVDCDYEFEQTENHYEEEEELQEVAEHCLGCEDYETCYGVIGGKPIIHAEENTPITTGELLNRIHKGIATDKDFENAIDIEAEWFGETEMEISVAIALTNYKPWAVDLFAKQTVTHALDAVKFANDMISWKAEELYRNSDMDEPMKFTFFVYGDGLKLYETTVERYPGIEALLHTKTNKSKDFDLLLALI